MRTDKKRLRHQAITEAAYALLAQKGYDGTSMLSIAKAAKASNETLYRWYGSKQGLFETMVRDNAEDAKMLLETALDKQDDPFQTLANLAPLLLAMLLGERAILLNRAAAADPSGELGAAISAGGRDAIQPMIASLMSALKGASHTDVKTLVDWFISLLVGDQQVKRAIGVLPEPTPAQINERSAMALAAFSQLVHADDAAPSRTAR